MSFAAVTSFVAPLVVPALVGAGVGAIVSETTGGKWEKGAMYGAGGGAALGGISALGGVGAPSAGLTVAEQMAAIAEPGYYGVAGPAATGFSTITQAIGAGAGIYGQLAQIEATKEMTEAQKIAAQTKLMEAEALKLYKPSATVLPTLASQQPVYVTPAATPAKPNYILYAILALLGYVLLKAK